MKIQPFLWLLAIFIQLSAVRLQANEAAQNQYDLKQVQLVSRILDQAHRIYSETWRTLLSSKSSPASPMKIVADELKKKRVNGKQSKWPIPEMVELNSLSRKMIFEFPPDHFPNVFGESLVILNRRAICEISYDEKDKIKSLLCRGLGRNLTKTQHLEFHEINYSANSGQLLEVKADKYENLLKKVQCSSTEPCLQMKVPFDGKIKIIENHILEKEKVEPPPPSNVKIENQTTEKQNLENEPKEQNEKGEHRQRRPEIPVEGDREPGL